MIKHTRYYLHGLLFAFSAPIAAYMTSGNVRVHAHPFSIWGVVLLCVIFFLIAALVSFALLRDHASAGMTASLAVLGIFYIQALFLPIILIALSASALLAVRKRTFDIDQPAIALNLLSLAVSAYFGAGYAMFVQSAPWDMNKSMAIPISSAASSSQPMQKPDIYYIVLDAYGSAEMLKALHRYDNSGFVSALEERGFIVVPNAKSNYTRTIHSVGSSLNMQYLDRVDEIMSDSDLWWPLTGTFADNETRKFLESQGYETVLVASGWSFTSAQNTDYYFQPYPIFINEFEEFYFSNTNLSLLGFLSDFGVSIPNYDTHRRTVLNGFERLKEIPALPSPKFTFVHIISPHPPFVFDAEGNPINPAYPFTIADNRYLITPPSKYEQGYLDQLTFINSQVVSAVDAILENSPTPPIIIVQGDHGPGNYIDASTMTPPCFYERYSVLNAYRLPGIDPDDVPQDITPINSFRLLLNFYFSADLEILPNRQYFSLQDSVHRFTDVSERINDACVFPSD
ncbi:MAG: hypothetical protein IT314_03035 [Anaerolineales bacterium]|nr:hypothetical protein [Anaerolineales bacterium]